MGSSHNFVSRFVSQFKKQRLHGTAFGEDISFLSFSRFTLAPSGVLALKNQAHSGVFKDE